MAGTIRGLHAVAAAGVTAAFAVVVAAVAVAEPTVIPSPTPTPSVSVSGGVQAPSSSTDATSSTPTTGGSSSTPTTGTAPAAAGGDVLDQLADEYAVGSGGGQLSNLLKMSLKLRSMGFKPSKANLAEIAKAMDYRPNQIPLIDALKDTIAYQQKIRAQMEILQQYQKQQGANSAVMGAGQMPGDSNPANLQPGAAAVPPGAGAPMMPSAPTP